MGKYLMYQIFALFAIPGIISVRKEVSHMTIIRYTTSILAVF